MADPKEVLTDFFERLSKDQSNKDRCKLQFSLLEEYHKAQEGSNVVFQDWVNTLSSRFPQYFPTNSPVSSMSSNENNSSNDNNSSENNSNSENNENNSNSENNENNSGMKPIFQKPTLSTGDCFYSSIYRAALEQNVLDKILACFGAKEPEKFKMELAFIQMFRNAIASRIRQGKLLKYIDEKGVETDIYDTLYNTLNKTIPGMIEKEEEGTRAKNIPAESKTIGTYRQVLMGFPMWLRSAIWNKLPPRAEFLELAAKGVSKMTNWAGQFEVELTKDILQRICGIKVVVENSAIKKAIPTDEKGNPILYLRNIDETHYEYFSFTATKNPTIVKKGGKRTTRKKQKSRS